MLFDSPSSFGTTFKILTFGESHGPAVGVVLDGVKPNLDFDLVSIQNELNRRRPGHSSLSSPRKESDQVKVLSGVFDGKTTGHPIALVVFNEDQRSGDYDEIQNLFRPGHADQTYSVKYGIRDHRGGGRSSARETIARVAAGAWAKDQLKLLGVSIRGFSREIANIRCENIDWSFIEENELRSCSPSAFEVQKRAVENARNEGDSVGGIIEIHLSHVPAGLGDPTFAKLDALLTYACMSVGSVRGVEIGNGFEGARLRGSQNNDPIINDPNLMSNRAGGIAGGISDGRPIILRCAVKPTSSITSQQETLDHEGLPQSISIKGRHDPCICPRVVPVLESMCAIVIYDCWLTQQSIDPAFKPANEWPS